MNQLSKGCISDAFVHLVAVDATVHMNALLFRSQLVMQGMHGCHVHRSTLMDAT